jgi:hypothetical protein
VGDGWQECEKLDTSAGYNCIHLSRGRVYMGSSSRRGISLESNLTYPIIQYCKKDADLPHEISFGDRSEDQGYE